MERRRKDGVARLRDEKSTSNSTLLVSSSQLELKDDEKEPEEGEDDRDSANGEDDS